MNVLDFPKLDRYINDFSSVLSNSESNTINEALAQHQRNTWEQVVVVLFPNRKWFELIDIWLKVFNENGIGEKTLNNGLLLIISTEERKIRIITGKGLELKYTEMICRDIVENHLRPKLDKDDYKNLLDAWVTIIKNPPKSNILSPKYNRILNKEDLVTTPILTIVFFIFGAVFWGNYNFWLWISFMAVLGLVIAVFLFMRASWQITRSIFFTFFISVLLGLIGYLAIFYPEKCIPTWETTYSCNRVIFGKSFDYTQNLWWSPSSSSDGFSSSRDSSSSFDGGGGSSNGGGYWD